MTASTAVARITPADGLILTSDQRYWNDDQITALRHMGLSNNTTRADMTVFHHVCQRTGLDPFARQIYMIERDGKQTIQTGIDGLRLIARRACDATGESLSIDETAWCGPDGQWRDVWLSDENPAAAKVTVTRGKGRFTAVALWREYVQTKRGGEVTRMWATRGAGQLAKCAEALALRKAFPQDLSGLYTDDEMGQAENVSRPVVEQPASGADRMRDALGVPPQTEEPAPEPPADESDSDETPGGASKAQLAKIGACMRDLGMTDRDMALDYVAAVIGHGIASRTELTKAEAHDVIERLRTDIAGQAAAS